MFSLCCANGMIGMFGTLPFDTRLDIVRLIRFGFVGECQTPPALEGSQKSNSLSAGRYGTKVLSHPVW